MNENIRRPPSPADVSELARRRAAAYRERAQALAECARELPTGEQREANLRAARRWIELAALQEAIAAGRKPASEDA